MPGRDGGRRKAEGEGVRMHESLSPCDDGGEGEENIASEAGGGEGEESTVRVGGGAMGSVSTA